MRDEPYRLDPWDIERYSLDEWNALMKYTNERAAAAKKAAKRGR